MLSNEVVERLGELLAKATVPPNWKVCGFAPNPYWIEALTIGAADDRDARRVADATTPQNADLIVAAVNALPELLRVYRAWLDAPVVDVWGGYDEYGITFRADSEAGELAAFQDSRLAGQSIRLVRDGDSGEG